MAIRSQLSTDDGRRHRPEIGEVAQDNLLGIQLAELFDLESNLDGTRALSEASGYKPVMAPRPEIVPARSTGRCRLTAK